MRSEVVSKILSLEPGFIFKCFSLGIWRKTCNFIRGSLQNIKNCFIRLFDYVTGTKKNKYCFSAVSLIIVVVIIVNLTVFLWPTSGNTGKC